MAYYVYMVTNVTGSVLYTGVTNNLVRRIHEHRTGALGRFTKRYNAHRLVWYQAAEEISSAIEREKQIKAGSRQRKLDLIHEMNPTWRDLAEELLE